MRRFVPCGWTLLALAGCAAPGGDIAPRADMAEVAARLTTFIEHEMADKGLPALSTVLVDDQDVVWAQGFGYADPVDSVPATAGTVYRVGSVSKLFTDLAVMQLVERGELGLDVPLREYIPEFHPGAGAGGAITLRQLTSHRAGLVREPPEGHYFDDTGTSLVATVASLNDTELVYPPETRTKYSNAGIAVVGYVLERLQQEPFPDYLARAVLAPLGMEHSSFQPDPAIVADLAAAYMWTYDGRVFGAPTFQLGMAPAGSMYAPVTDLGKFMSALFAGGEGERGPVVASATIDSMLTPQFAAPGAQVGYGIGFRVSQLEGRRRIGHGGAIYGFATDLTALPDDKLGVASVTTMDGANTVVARIDEYALRLMLAAKDGRALPEPVITSSVPPAMAAHLEGRYGPPGRRVEIDARDEGVFAVLGDRRTRLRMLGDTVVTDGRLSFGTRIVPVEQGLVVGRDTLRRLPEERPASAPSRWAALLGEYGWDFNTLYVYEQDGALHALIEWFFINRLEEIAPDVFAFPDEGGLYHGEQIRFVRDAAGRVTHAEAAGVVFVRREVGTEAGATFTIDPVRPVDELRAAALAAAPPEEAEVKRTPDLVELHSLDSTIAYDIRYATTNNFMQTVFYDEPKAFLQRPAAEALVQVHRGLRRHGLGLMIHDAYRPWYVTKMFWDATPEESKIFVANPANGSRHNRGAAVDLTLFDLETGEPIQMVGGYDEFSDRSFPFYWGGTSEQRWHRDLLRNAMEAEGFRVYEFEWWHFDYQDWAEYGIGNWRFDEVPGM